MESSGCLHLERVGLGYDCRSSSKHDIHEDPFPTKARGLADMPHDAPEVGAEAAKSPCLHLHSEQPQMAQERGLASSSVAGPGMELAMAVERVEESADTPSHRGKWMVKVNLNVLGQGKALCNLAVGKADDMRYSQELESAMQMATFSCVTVQTALDSAAAVVRLALEVDLVSLGPEARSQRLALFF